MNGFTPKKGNRNANDGWGDYGAPSSPPNWSTVKHNGSSASEAEGWGGRMEHVPVSAASSGEQQWNTPRNDFDYSGTGYDSRSTGFQSVASNQWKTVGASGEVMGSMTPSAPAAAHGGGAASNTLDGEEPPLLEELGIRPDHMMKKMIAVMFPFKHIPQELANDSDMAGPVAICLSLGFLLFVGSGGEMQFSAIYSFFLFGSIGIYMTLNLMAQHGSIDILRVFSVLGYCLLPIVLLAALAVLFEIKTRWWAGMIAVLCILWSSITSTRFFEAGLKCREQRYLIAYPVLMLYSCFALITVF